MTDQLYEIMPEMFTRSEILISNFSEIGDIDQKKNIQQFFIDNEKLGSNPRLH